MSIINGIDLVFGGETGLVLADKTGLLPAERAGQNQ